MIATPMDATIMQRATGKNQCTINGQVSGHGFSLALYYLSCYILCFTGCAVRAVVLRYQVLANSGNDSLITVRLVLHLVPGLLGR